MRLLESGEELKPGGWYFFVVCRSCKGEIIFAEAPSLEQEARPKVRGVKASCFHCKAEDTYEPNEVQRGQVAESS